MNVSVVGSGYVGTSVAACLADLGHDVVAIDIDQSIVDAINAGDPPIHEPGLDDLLARHVPDRLRATTDYDAVLDTDLTFLAIQTPSRDDGSIDVGPLATAARMLGETLAANDGYHVVVVKSTVVPGMVEDRIAPAIADASGHTPGEEFSVVVNPEFQSQGSAVDDFMAPDKIVLGTADGDDRALGVLRDLYAPLIERSGAPVVETGRREAAMIKYANNVFLAGKVSLINELGNVCKEYGVDSYAVADAIGLDDRIGEQFLRSGVGWGGSCLPKDTDALRAAARAKGYDPVLLDAIVAVNDGQPGRMLDLLDRHVDVAGERVAVLGLSFKAGTDDIRGSRATLVIEGLLERGAQPVAYDPVAAEHMREIYPDIEYAGSAADALAGAYGALVTTDWDEFAALDDEFAAMAEPVVVDGRRMVDPPDGVTYEGLTW